MKIKLILVSILIAISTSSCVSTKSTLKNVDDNAPIPSLTPNNTFVLTEYSKDKKYGYDPDYPINVFYRNTKDENTVEEKTYREISVPVKTNTDGSRQPGVIQMGLNSYMKRNALINPVQIIDAHIKKEKLKIFDTMLQSDCLMFRLLS